MYIENARIDDVTIVPTSDVTIVPTRYGMQLELKLELQDGELYTNTFNMVTPIEDIATLCDVVGVQSYGELIGARIRVWVPDYENIQIIGNATDNNKWLHLKQFNRMILHSRIGLLYTGDKKDRKKIERKAENTMKTNYNAEYIKGVLKGQEDRLRQRRLNPEYITTLVEQADYLIERETDAECLKYITETFVDKISEHFYLGLNAKKYVNQVSDEYDREIAMSAIGLVVIAGCTGDYPSITNQ